MTKKNVIEGIAVAVALVFVAWLMFGSQISNIIAPAQDLIPSGDVSTSTAGSISSIRIEPSSRDGGWTMYKSGAQVVVGGENLERVTVKAMPTGAGMGQEYPNGLILGDATKNGNNWVLPLPDNILATNLWVEAVDEGGNIIKSADLGNVGFEE